MATPLTASFTAKRDFGFTQKMRYLSRVAAQVNHFVAKNSERDNRWPEGVDYDALINFNQ